MSSERQTDRQKGARASCSHTHTHTHTRGRSFLVAAEEAAVFGAVKFSLFFCVSFFLIQLFHAISPSGFLEALCKQIIPLPPHNAATFSSDKQSLWETDGV